MLAHHRAGTTEKPGVNAKSLRTLVERRVFDNPITDAYLAWSCVYTQKFHGDDWAQVALAGNDIRQNTSVIIEWGKLVVSAALPFTHKR